MRIRAAVAVLCLLAATSSAHADLVQGTRSELLIERSHTIDLRLAPGHATARVRRVLDNGGPRHDQAVVDIDLPAGAVAVGLRTLGALNGQPRWFDAELMEAEAAAAKYKELTGIGGYYPKDPALLSWRSAQSLKLQVFPVAPRSLKTVEYTLEMPTEYEAGHDVLHLARLGTEARAADVIVSPDDPRDRIKLAGKLIAPGTRLSFNGNDDLDLVLERHDQARLGGTLATIPMAQRRVMHHLRIEASSRLSQLPTSATVVVVLDGSRSIEDADVDAERAAAAAYLSHLPDARVEVITFDRAPHRRYGRFVTAATASSDLARGALVRKNGSAVDLAMAEAESVLLASPPGPRRVVVLTDLRTRAALDPEKLRGTFARSGAIVHVGTVRPGGAWLSRTDDGPWASFARATGGVQWFGTATSDHDREADMRSTYEEWARPVRIDHLKARTPGLTENEIELPETLAEGAFFDATRIDPTSMTALVLTGELWSSPLHTTIQPAATGNTLWSALAFGHGILGELTPEEQMTLAKRGHAVSPVTSLLAIEPGVRPSTEGLEEGGSGSGFGSGRGRLGSSHSTRAPRMSTFDPMAFLKSALGQAWQTCGGTGKQANVELETTRAEIVEVTNVTVDPTAAAGTAACLREATWSVDLPAGFESEHATFAVAL